MLRRAQTQESERPEISYALGQALYLQDKPEEAVEALNQALEKDPTLKGVARLRDLIQEIREPSPLFRGASFIVILLILFTIHEYAHAYSAFKFGDDTAKNAGRLTLNPFAHLDLIGSIILPATLIIQQASVVFGWAKPVPVNCQNFKQPEKDYMVVSFAGPGANLLMAMACFICLQLIALSMRIISPEALSLHLTIPSAGVAITGIAGASYFANFIFIVKQLMFTNLVLGIFNLIPVPPLDGSGVLGGILGPVGRQRLEKFRPYGFFIVLLIVLTPIFNVFLFLPFLFVWSMLNMAMSAMGFG